MLESIRINFFGTELPKIHRQIAISGLLLNISSLAIYFLRSDSQRERITFSQLKDRMATAKDDPFIQWFQNLERTREPERIIILRYLIPKIAIAAAYILTKKAPISHLVSQSQLISKISLPILNMAQTALLIPLIATAIYLALVYLTPQEKYPAHEKLKKGAESLSQGSEILWNLYFMLRCLQLSQTTYQSLLATVFSSVVSRFFPSLSLLGHLLFKADPWPTWGFCAGAFAIMINILASPKPYDVKELERLFYQASPSQAKEKVKDFDEYQIFFRKVLEAISLALQEGKISRSHAEELKKILHKMGKEKLNFLLNEEFTAEQARITQEFEADKNTLIQLFNEEFKADQARIIQEFETDKNTLIQNLENLQSKLTASEVTTLPPDSSLSSNELSNIGNHEELLSQIHGIEKATSEREYQNLFTHILLCISESHQQKSITDHQFNELKKTLNAKGLITLQSLQMNAAISLAQHFKNELPGRRANSFKLIRDTNS